MSRIRWTPAAADDLEHIYAYLSRHRPELAASTVRDLYDRIRTLKTMPFIGHSGRIEGTREFVHPRMPYIVVYRVNRTPSRLCTSTTARRTGLALKDRTEHG